MPPTNPPNNSTTESDLQFENDIRRLCMTSKIPRDIANKIIEAHRDKQDQKLRIRRGEEARGGAKESVDKKKKRNDERPVKPRLKGEGEGGEDAGRYRDDETDESEMIIRRDDAGTTVWIR